MTLKKILVILAVIIFPWILLPLAFYCAWRRGRINFLTKKLVPIKRSHFGGGLIEEVLTLKYFKPAHGGCYSVIPRNFRVQYVYAIEVRDLPERLMINLEDVIRATVDNVEWGGRNLTSLTVGDRIDKVQVYTISRTLHGIGKDVEKEAFEVSLSISDALGTNLRP